MPIDIQQAHTSKDKTEDQQLANACAEAIEQHGQNDLRYWKEKLLARQPSVSNIRQDLHMQHEETVLSKKRKVGQDGFTFGPNSLLDDSNVPADADTLCDDDGRAYKAKSIKNVDEDPDASEELPTLSMKTPASDRTKRSARAVQLEGSSSPVSSSSSKTLLDEPLSGKPTAKMILTDPMYSR